MPRLTQRRYETRVIFAMSIYVVALLLLLPLARTASSVALKGFLAVLPALPMLYVIWLMAQRVRDCDELQQRTHLVALGVTVAVVAACSLIGGFLATAHVWPIDGSILIWVFPLMLLCYEMTRRWIARRYGGSPACEGAMPMHWRMAAVAIMMAVVGIFAYVQHNAFDAGLFLGLGGGLVLLALIKFFADRRVRQKGAQGDDEA